MKIHRIFGILFLSIILFQGCNDSSEDPDPCLNGPEINIENIQASIEGKATGEIIVSSSGGIQPYTFSIDGTSFQGSTIFSGLEAGSYTLTVQDSDECTSSDQANVDELPEVFYANQIRPILDANCQVSGCHGSNVSIPSFGTYAEVKDRAGLIKSRTSDKSMPPNGSLQNNEIQLIADWVDLGAPNN